MTKFTTFREFLLAEANKEASQEIEQVNEDHFKKGELVASADGKTHKVISSEGEGDDEVYTVKCTKSGKERQFKPNKLKKA